jgi:serine phosphatase RsbU (regulator of sigma subunit)
MNYYIALTALLLYCTTTFGSNNHKDSLAQFNLMIAELPKIKEDSARLNELVKLHYYQQAIVGELNKNNSQMFNLMYAKEAIGLAIKLNKLDTLKALTVDAGYIFDLNQEYDSSYVYYSNCLNILEAQGAYDISSSIAQNILYNNNELQNTLKQNRIVEIAQEKKIDKLIWLAIIVLMLFLLMLFFYILKARKTNTLLTSQKDAIQKSKLEIDSSIVYAKNVQQSIITTELKFKWFFKDSFVLFTPKDTLSGDFLWTLKKDDLTYFAVADCTGHGVPGALISIVGTLLLDSILTEETYKSPATILTELHLKLVDALNQNDPNNKHNHDGMDIGVFEVNETLNTLKFAGANRHLTYIRNGIVTDYPGTKRPIGGTQVTYDKPFVDDEIVIQKNDIMYSYTDGYQDQMGGLKNKKIQRKGLLALLQKGFTNPMLQQKQLLHSAFTQHMGTNEQVDDVLVVGIKF